MYNSNHSPMNQQVKLYSSTAALTLESSKLSNGSYTVNTELAPIINNNADWSQKIILQIGEYELPILSSVLLGYLPKCEFKRPTKGLKVERQSNKVFLYCSERNKGALAMPINLGQVFQASTLLLSQLKRNYNLEAELLIASLRGSAALYQP